MPVIGRRCPAPEPLRPRGARGEIRPAPGRAVIGRRRPAPRGTGEVTSGLRAECVYDSLVGSRAVRLWRIHHSERFRCCEVSGEGSAAWQEK